MWHGEALQGVRLRHRETQLEDVRLHLVEAGEGPLVLLLHGFPECWYGWRFQLPALARAGFRVVAPDLRGYGASGRPAGVDAYRPERLAADVAGLIRTSGASRAAVVGHDWGAVAAWAFASLHGAMLERLVVLNGPHPRQLAEALRRPSQMVRSAYMGFFQLPLLPEALLRAGDFALLRRLLPREVRRPGALTPDDVERYVEALRPPGALTSALNYYRAAAREALRGRPLPARRVDAPLLVVWGRRDPFLLPSLARPDPRLAPQARVEVLGEAGHFVHLDAPERVSELIVEHLSPLRPEPRERPTPPQEASP